MAFVGGSNPSTSTISTWYSGCATVSKTVESSSILLVLANFRMRVRITVVRLALNQNEEVRFLHPQPLGTLSILALAADCKSANGGPIPSVPSNRKVAQLVRAFG